MSQIHHVCLLSSLSWTTGLFPTAAAICLEEYHETKAKRNVHARKRQYSTDDKKSSA